MDNLKAKKRHPEEIAVYSAIYVCAAFSVLLLLGIIVYVFAKGARRVNWAFLTGLHQFFMELWELPVIF